MASNVSSAAQVIEARLSTQWGATTPILWENATDEPPDVSDGWIRPTILWGDSFLITKNGRNTIVGVLSINVYTPKNAGMGVSDGYVDDLRDAFNRLKLAGADETIRFGIPTAGQAVTDPSEGWMVKNVSCPFEIDETGT
jgi:hypothetical protein